MDDDKLEKCRKRYWILALYSSVLVLYTGTILQYTIIADIVMDFYRVSMYTINIIQVTCSIVGLISLTTSNFITKKFGIQVTMVVGVSLLTMGNIFKCFAIRRHLFIVHIISQSICVIGGSIISPLMLTIPNVWFPSHQRSTVISILYVAQLIGTQFVAFIETQIIPETPILGIGKGLSNFFIFQASVTVIVCVAILFSFEERPTLNKSKATREMESLTKKKDGNYCMLENKLESQISKNFTNQDLNANSKSTEDRNSTDKMSAQIGSEVEKMDATQESIGNQANTGDTISYLDLIRKSLNVKFICFLMAAFLYLGFAMSHGQLSNLIFTHFFTDKLNILGLMTLVGSILNVTSTLIVGRLLDKKFDPRNMYAICTVFICVFLALHYFSLSIESIALVFTSFVLRASVDCVYLIILSIAAVVNNPLPEYISMTFLLVVCAISPVLSIYAHTAIIYNLGILCNYFTFIVSLIVSIPLICMTNISTVVHKKMSFSV